MRDALAYELALVGRCIGSDRSFYYNAYHLDVELRMACLLIGLAGVIIGIVIGWLWLLWMAH